MSQHPSYLELDLVPMDAASRDVVAHVGACARCQAHVDAVRGIEGGALPGWVESDGPPVGSRRGVRSWSRAQLGVAAGAMAMAAAVLLFLRTRGSPSDPPYVGEKGTAAVEVLVQRDSVARLWDGRALRPGDRLGLMVTCAGRRHVTLGTGTGAAVRVLADAACEPRAFQLPVSVILDAEGTEDELLFAFGDAVVTAGRLRAESAKARDLRSLEIVTIVIPKERVR